MAVKSVADMKLVMQGPADVLPSAQALKLCMQSLKVFICFDCVRYRKTTALRLCWATQVRGGVFLEFIIHIQLQMLLYLLQDWPHFFYHSWMCKIDHRNASCSSLSFPLLSDNSCMKESTRGETHWKKLIRSTGSFSLEKKHWNFSDAIMNYIK